MTADDDRGPNRPRSLSFLSQDNLSVATHQVVAPDGSYDPERVPDLDDDQLVDLYRWMMTERITSRRLVQLQRRGELGTTATGRGQEGSIVGAGYALEPDDWLFIGRGWTALVMQGASIRDVILFWRGIEDASKYFAEQNCMITIPIGSHLPIITGVGWGMALSGADSVATAFFGDGATSTGAAHEGINFAGVLDAPVLFFCQNNQYAISTPFEKQTKANTLAQRALGYGIDGIRVDGNDVLAVYDAVSAARERVRQGQPVFVESVTYRRDAHTTSDDAGRYRDDEEVDAWAERDPIDRFRRFLEAEGLWSDAEANAIEAEIEEAFDEALAEANAHEHRDVSELFVHLYEEMPPGLRRQLEGLEAFLEEHPEAMDYIEQRPKG